MYSTRDAAGPRSSTVPSPAGATGDVLLEALGTVAPRVTSPARTNPWGPLPLTDARSTPWRAARRRANGVASTRPAASAGGGGGAVAVGWAGTAFTSSRSSSPEGGASAVGVAPEPLLAADFAGCAVGGASGAAAPLPPAAMVASVAPTVTVSPSWATIASSVPAAGEGTSTSTLSVVTSTNDSPSVTLSPTALSHREMVPSVTDSPIAGRVRGTLSDTG
jgi:hypothetical protein